MKTITNIIERLTLYDILGYFVPGVIASAMAILFSSHINSAFTFFKDTFGNEWVIVAIAFCYELGIVLSEVSKLLNCVVEKVRDIAKCKDNRIENCISLTELEDCMKKYGIEASDIENDARKLASAFPAIHAIVQTAEKYNRVHNYRAMGLMSRTMAAGIFVGACGVFDSDKITSWPCRIVLFLCFFVISIVLLNRQIEHSMNTDVYECMWFMELAHSDEKSKVGNNN